jgi:hypothetical protein
MTFDQDVINNQANDNLENSQKKKRLNSLINIHSVAVAGLTQLALS